MQNERLVSFLLRAGISVVFFYAAVGSFLVPESWVGYFPIWLREVIPGTVLLMIFSIYELFLGLWLLSGKKTFIAAIVASLTLFSIVVTNVVLLDVLFRDIAILFAALSLAALSYKKK